MVPAAEVRDVFYPPPKALEICARDLEVDAAELRVLPGAVRGVYYKSDIFYVDVGGSDAPLYVVKVDSGAYDARHEMEALQYAAWLLGQSSPSEGRSEGGLGVVRPVGWGADPNFLITRYQPGELAQTAFDRVVLRWRGPRPLSEAHANARLIARWLGEFRARGAGDGGGLDPSAYLAEIRNRADALIAPLDARKQMNVLVRHVEHYLNQLGDEDIARMIQRYPNRGDARPKNFLVSDEGVLYAFDMEGFGFGSMEHDLSCLHHALEYDGVRTPAAGRRASTLWMTFWEEYMQFGSSPPFALLGYVYFLLDRMRSSAQSASGSRLRRRARTQVWLRSRFGWLATLTGDLYTDAVHIKCNV